MDPQHAQPAPPPDSYDPAAKVGNALTVTQPGERTVCEIKRHPIGILGIYIATGILLVIVAVLAFVIVPGAVNSSSANKAGALVFLIVTIFSLIFAFISTKVYSGNAWVVTTDSLTQIDQDSLFNRQSSQLSLGNLEDITSEQNGILPHMFNYGRLKAETAGERSKFVFPYCPNPNYYAQQILSARENFEQNRSGQDEQRTYRGEGSYAQPAPQPQAPSPTQSQPYPPIPQQPEPAPPSPQGQGQAGDPGYGAYPPPAQPLPPTDDNGNGLSPVEYPGSSDQGVNTNL